MRKSLKDYGDKVTFTCTHKSKSIPEQNVSFPLPLFRANHFTLGGGGGGWVILKKSILQVNIHKKMPAQDHCQKTHAHTVGWKKILVRYSLC